MKPSIVDSQTALNAFRQKAAKAQSKRPKRKSRKFVNAEITPGVQIYQEFMAEQIEMIKARAAQMKKAPAPQVPTTGDLLRAQNEQIYASQEPILKQLLREMAEKEYNNINVQEVNPSFSQVTPLNDARKIELETLYQNYKFPKKLNAQQIYDNLLQFYNSSAVPKQNMSYVGMPYKLEMAMSKLPAL